MRCIPGVSERPEVSPDVGNDGQENEATPGDSGGCDVSCHPLAEGDAVEAAGIESAAPKRYDANTESKRQAFSHSGLYMTVYKRNARSVSFSGMPPQAMKLTRLMQFRSLASSKMAVVSDLAMFMLEASNIAKGLRREIRHVALPATGLRR